MLVRHVAAPSVQAVVSRIRHVRKTHHESLKKASQHARLKKTVSRHTAVHKALKKSPPEHHIRIKKNNNKGSLSSFCYWLGATSKAILEPQKS